MVRLIFLLLLLFTSLNLYSDTLNKEEEKYFNFFDFNKDDLISLDEINQSLKLIFQLIDENNDNKISKEEIIKIKNIIESLS